MMPRRWWTWSFLKKQHNECKHPDMSASSNVWANLNRKAINSLVRFVNAKKARGRELCLATDRRNKQLFLARFLLKTNANSRLPTWFPNPKQYRGQMCLVGPNTCSFSVSCSELWHCSLPEPRRPCALWNTKKRQTCTYFVQYFQHRHGSNHFLQ